MSHLCFFFVAPPVISQTGCRLCEFGACCIAIFMHGFTAKGSLIHFSQRRPLQRISVSAYSISAALWLRCQLAPGVNCIEVIYMQDEYCICISICPSQKQRCTYQVSVSARFTLVTLLNSFDAVLKNSIAFIYFQSFVNSGHD